MCILSEKEQMSVIHHIFLGTSSFFIPLETFEMHGQSIYVKGDTNHPNTCKYKFHPHKKRLNPPIWKLCFRWRFDKVIFSNKERL